MVIATSLTTACTQEGMVIQKDTDQPLQILLTTNSNVLVVELPPHQTQRVGLSVGGDGCNPDIGYSAYVAQGPDEITRSPAIATLGPACEGDTWTIR